jgi:hypothetical protein
MAVVEDNDESGSEAGGGAGGSTSSRWIVYSGSLDKSIKVWRVCDEAPDSFAAGSSSARSFR